MWFLTLKEVNQKCLKTKSSRKCLDLEEMRVEGLSNKEYHDLYCSGSHVKEAMMGQSCRPSTGNSKCMYNFSGKTARLWKKGIGS